MNRRCFLGALLGTAALDPERLLWVPGRKLISIPPPPIATVPVRLSEQLAVGNDPLRWIITDVAESSRWIITDVAESSLSLRVSGVRLGLRSDGATVYWPFTISLDPVARRIATIA